MLEKQKCAFELKINKKNTDQLTHFYTPGIYVEGYIVFVFPFVCLIVRLFIRSYFRPVRGITSKFYVQATRVEYISPTTHQKVFIFGPKVPWRVGFHSMTFHPRVHARGGARGQNLGHL